jgi:hypothetical protein
MNTNALNIVFANQTRPKFQFQLELDNFLWCFFSSVIALSISWNLDKKKK